MLYLHTPRRSKTSSPRAIFRPSGPRLARLPASARDARMDFLRIARVGRSLLLSMILSATVLPDSVYGARRYVDNSQPQACRDNESFGSEAQPWCTISYAIGRLNGGDELYVKQGT